MIKFLKFLDACLKHDVVKTRNLNILLIIASFKRFSFNVITISITIKHGLDRYILFGAAYWKHFLTLIHLVKYEL